jgi:hypothetical protein
MRTGEWLRQRAAHRVATAAAKVTRDLAEMSNPKPKPPKLVRRVNRSSKRQALKLYWPDFVARA